MEERERVLKILSDNLDYLKSRFGVKNVVLFGSLARGENREESDVDLLVDMPPRFDTYYEVKEFLERSLNRTVDLGLEKNLRPFIRSKIESDRIDVQ